MNHQTILVGLDQDFSQLRSREEIMENIKDFFTGKELTSDTNPWGLFLTIG
jgi:hypothetical protein